MRDKIFFIAAMS